MFTKNDFETEAAVPSENRGFNPLLGQKLKQLPKKIKIDDFMPRTTESNNTPKSPNNEGIYLSAVSQTIKKINIEIIKDSSQMLFKIKGRSQQQEGSFKSLIRRMSTRI